VPRASYFSMGRACGWGLWGGSLFWLALALLPAWVVPALAYALHPGPTVQQLLAHYWAPARMVEIRLLLLGAALAWAALAWLYGRYRPGWASLRLVWPPLDVVTLGFVGVSALRIYWAYTLPITYDEAYSYLNFSAHGPHVALFYYAGTNNHPLFNALNSLTAGLGLRLLPTLLGLALLWVGVRQLRRWWGTPAALLALLVLAAAPLLTFYGILARGYGLQLLALVLATGHWQQLVARGLPAGHVVRQHGAFLGWCTVALVTLPTAVFPLAGFYVAWGVLVARAVAAPAPWLRSMGALALLGCAYYLPLFAFNGLGGLLGTGTLVDQQAAFSLLALAGQVPAVWQQFVELGPYSYLLGLLLAGLGLRYAGHPIMLLAALQLQLWFPLFALLGLLPFERILLYQLWFSALIGAFVLHRLGRLGPPVFAHLVLLLALLWASWQLYRFPQLFRRSYPEPYEAQLFLQRHAQYPAPYFSSDAYYHLLKLEELPGLLPQRSWPQVAYTQARTLIVSRDEPLALIPPVFRLVYQTGDLQVYVRWPGAAGTHTSAPSRPTQTPGH
jgi:hypothetical protein